MKLSVIFLAWYLILKTVEGSVSIGPYDKRSDCMAKLGQMLSRLEPHGLKLTVADCIWRDKI